MDTDEILFQITRFQEVFSEFRRLKNSYFVRFSVQVAEEVEQGRHEELLPHPNF